MPAKVTSAAWISFKFPRKIVLTTLESQMEKWVCYWLQTKWRLCLRDLLDAAALHAPYSWLGQRSALVPNLLASATPSVARARRQYPP